jgi:AraC family transcriptional regulator, regulatory protein of adaptative response / DNA-3-methyladenine glycosylase II
MAPLDPATCYRALQTRDERFDGRLFVGVTSTGIYCRPICPARTPRQENCRFFPTAPAAQEAGFRPCLRCRPEAAPEHAAWRGTSNTVARALERIAQGALDGELSVEQLAEGLGVGERHLRRLFQEHLGASPIAVAQTRRVLFAKQLLHETRLPLGEVALAAGFQSVRRFNEVFQSLYHRPPSALRRKAQHALPAGSAGAGGVRLRLAYRPPYDWHALLAHLRARALAGVEQVSAERYLRTWREQGEIGSVEVEHTPERQALSIQVRAGRLDVLPRVVQRIRHVFDLGADTRAIHAQLASDEWLAPLLVERPGLRVAGAWDGFELGVRAILGQQVSVSAARQLGERLVRLCGSRAVLGAELTSVFPGAEQVLAADLSQLGMPRARREALHALAQAACADARLFEAEATLEETLAKLRRVRGIGDWTAQYIALRAAREPDALPASDRGLLRGAELCAGTRVSAAELERRAERWRPWRAYAAQQLWQHDAAGRPVGARAEPGAKLEVSGAGELRGRAATAGR